MKTEKFYNRIFKNRQELSKDILKSFMNNSQISLTDSRKDYYLKVIDRIVGCIEKDLNIQKTKRVQKAGKISKEMLSILEDTIPSTSMLYQLLELIFLIRNILIEKISALHYGKIGVDNIANLIRQFTDYYVLALCKNHEIGMTIKIKHDKSIIENLKIVKNDLQKQLDLTYQMIKNTPTALAGCDSELTVKLWNSIAENLTGYKQADIIGESIMQIFTLPSQNVIRSHLSQNLQRRKRIQLNFQTKEGGIFNAFVLVSKLKTELRQKIQYIINFVDLSKEERLKSQLEKIEQLEAIARLSDSMMHDIRNPINSLALNFDVLTQLFSDKSSANKTVNDIVDKINRQISNLTQNLNRYVGYSRITEMKLEIVDIRKSIDELILDTRHRLIRKDITLRYHRSNAELIIKGDLNQLIRVVQNLIDNAIDALEDKGNIDVYLMKRKNKVIIRIEDDGRGIKSDNLQNVFKPYFTTKDKGSGLGLFIVREIVRAHNGKVYCASSDDQRTRFTVSLPAIND